VFLASSAWIFGRPAAEPQDESTSIAPVEPYGAAKAYAQHLLGSFRDHYGLHLTTGIFFNHESPRRPPQFVTRKISSAVARIAHDGHGSLALGDVTAVRDWGFAGDYVNGAWRAVRADRPADYVFATGRLHSVADFAERAFRRVGLDWREHVTHDRALTRSGQVANLRGNPSKAEHELGWRRTMSFEGLVDAMVDADVSRATAGS
jgi:GDPmannose 4,6-dehydratase